MNEEQKCDILIVDDVDDNLYLLEDLIDDEFDNVIVHQATCGAEALEVLKKQAIDLVILDIQMPDMNGFEVAKEIKSNPETENMPIIFLTAAYKSDEFIQNGFKIGAVDYITKPFDINQLVNRLRLYLTVTVQSRELKNMNKTLEAKVAEKTKELQELNKKLEQEKDEVVVKSRDKDKIIEQQSKLAIMGEMISMIAHQWRQPITAISSLIQGIELKDRLGRLSSEYVKDVTKDVKDLTSHMSQTIDDFRDFFKPDKKKELHHPADVLNKAISLIRSEFESNGIYINTSFDVEHKMYLYKNELMQVVLNILNNAKDAIKDNGVEKGIINIKVQECDDRLCIYIEDNAGGVSSELKDKIFNPYFSTKSKNGTGLGLYMSKIIIDEHMEGLLSVQNSDIGAEFVIKLPVVLQE
jgi:C4-dicarboxylate-specific signal transduction histidine kinase